jgi:FkbM family methyltransferase
MQLSRVIQRIGRLAGLEIRSEAYASEFLYDLHLKRMLDRHRITTVLDIGANVGGFGLLLRRIGFAGRIVSFEPVQEPFEKLTALAQADGNWEAHRIAFGDRTETRQIHVMAGSELSSFLPPAETSTAMQVRELRPVEVRMLDEWQGVAWERAFVKVDTQGHDPAVLRGGAGVLERVPLLQTEVSVRAIYQGMTRWTDALATIDALGFDITGLFPVSRDEHLRVREFDCLAVNRRVLG